MGLRWAFRFGAAFVFCTSAYAHAAGCEAVSASASMRLVSVRQDLLLHSRWGLMVDCGHPERPSRWMLLTDADDGLKFAATTQSTMAAVREPMVVRAGETVRAWRQDGMTSIETRGIAEQSGVAGARIQVRLPGHDVDGQDVERHVSGVVDGVGSVEIQ
jgi:Chaperone for flagella basal body P-ring formation